jgi:hypothetical protein
MNYDRVVIENNFGALKGQWRILKDFNIEVDKAATVILICCVLHNFCDIHYERVPFPTYTRRKPSPY